MPNRDLKRLRIAALLFTAAAVSTSALKAQPADGDAFGNWRVNCEISEKGGEQGCFIVQDLVLREGGQRVLQFAVGFVRDTPDPIGLISLPLGISLPPGTMIQIDEREPARIAIERCEPNGCRAGMKLNATLLEGLRNGKQVSVTFYDAKRQPIDVPLSLDGFADGLDAVAPGGS